MRLEAVAQHHLPLMVQLAGGDPIRSEFSTWIPDGNDGDPGLRWLERIDDERRCGAAEVFAALDAATGAVMGTVRLGGMLAPGSCQLSYWIGVAYRGRGYATAAGSIALELAYTRFGPRQRVCGFVDEENRPSLRVLEKLGFVLQGRMDGGRLYLEHTPTRQSEGRRREWK